MKKIYLLMLFFTAMLVSCGNEISELEPNSENGKSSKVVNDYFRDYESALSIAESYVFGSDASSTTRAQKKPAVKDHYMYSPCSTRSANQSASFHVINFEDEKGFALISADKRATAVYAFSDKGNLYLNKMTEDSGWDEFLALATEYYSDEIQSPSRKMIDTTSNPEVPPFISIDDIEKYGDMFFNPIVEINGVRCRLKTTKHTYNYGTILSTLWDQCSPYNYYFPNYGSPASYFDGRMATGCSPIAIGQILTHYRHPASYNEDEFDWDIILSKPKYVPFEVSAASKYTAKLIYDIALAAGADLDGNDADVGIKFPQAIQAFTKLGFKFKYSVYSSDKVLESLKKNRPVYMRGTGSNGGHAWVVDAGRKITESQDYYYDEPPYNYYCSGPYREDKYLHRNWGDERKNPNSTAYFLDVFTGPNGEKYNGSPAIIYDIGNCSADALR